MRTTSLLRCSYKHSGLKDGFRRGATVSTAHISGQAGTGTDTGHPNGSGTGKGICPRQRWPCVRSEAWCRMVQTGKGEGVGVCARCADLVVCCHEHPVFRYLQAAYPCSRWCHKYLLHTCWYRGLAVQTRTQNQVSGEGQWQIAGTYRLQWHASNR